MADKFQNRYRISSVRLQNWDYGWNATYFVTICTQNRKCYFGDIVDGKMQLSEIGEIANKCWMKIPKHFPFVELDEFVVMPNHLHGIIIINKSNDNYKTIDQYNDTVKIQNIAETQNLIETQNLASLQGEKNNGRETISQIKNKFGSQSKNLASIIRGLKTGVTKRVRQICDDFAWQSRFYDHIIRNNESFEKIRTYIIENPLKWNNDKYFIQNTMMIS